jgi:arylsulfatase A-like enzyme
MDNTLLVITSDHGEALGEHGEYFTHSSIYNEIMRVPLIAKFPGGYGRRVEAPCQLTDIMPTILDYLGIENDLLFDGSSLLSYIESEGEQDLRDIFVAQPMILACRPARIGIVRGRYKYIGCPDQPLPCELCGLVHNQGAELYDLVADPVEMNNICEMETHKCKELKEALSGFGW